MREEWYWIDDADLVYVPAKRLKDPGEGGAARMEVFPTKRVVAVPASSLTEDRAILAPSKLGSYRVDDMVECEDISAPFILWNLRQRFQHDHIYTSIATILISINPFKAIPGMYDVAVMQQIRETSEAGERTRPHVFTNAASAYRGLVEGRGPQTMLISGESGAGKTEATKRCLEYFVFCGGGSGDDSAGDGQPQSQQGSIQGRILSSNPILEAFGNAKTLRNNNSSRFGKWMEVQFEQQGKGTLDIVGCSIVDYLLETSRVLSQIPGERNFHIFYQLCKLYGTSEEWKQELGLHGVGAFGVS